MPVARSQEIPATTDGSRPPPLLLQQLANPVRWQLVTALARSDARVNELVTRVRQPGNLVSYHLRNLKRAGIVVDRRSSADGRDVYYALDFDHLRTAFVDAAGAVHPGLAAPDAGAGRPWSTTSERARVLFLCSRNSARSQMAEVALRTLAGDLADVHSAGSDPDRVHPLALLALREAGYTTEGLHAKDITDFVGQRFDYVITLCDRIREDCPTFPGDPERIHWSLLDPLAVNGSADEVYAAFQDTCTEVTTRVRYLLAMMRGDGRADGALA